MKDSVMKQIVNKLKSEHAEAVNRYFEACHYLDSRLAAFKSNLFLKSFYCVVKHPSRKYNYNRLLKLDSLELHDKPPEYDSSLMLLVRGIELPVLYKLPPRWIVAEFISQRLEKIQKYGSLDFSNKKQQ